MVLDVRIGGMSGPEVLTALRTEGSPLADRTVFICTDLNLTSGKSSPASAAR
jgi:FixJ family two-component response regulator